MIAKRLSSGYFYVRFGVNRFAQGPTPESLEFFGDWSTGECARAYRLVRRRHDGVARPQMVPQ